MDSEKEREYHERINRLEQVIEELRPSLALEAGRLERDAQRLSLDARRAATDGAS